MPKIDQVKPNAIPSSPPRPRTTQPTSAGNKPVVRTDTTKTTVVDHSFESGVGVGLKMTGYGDTKSGKTRLLATFPKPLLIVGSEDGTKSIADLGPRGRKEIDRLSTGNPLYRLYRKGVDTQIDFCRITSSSEYEELLNRDGYHSKGLDHAGGFQGIILKEVLGLAEVPVTRNWGMAQQKDWQIVNAQIVERLSKLFDQADRQGINVMVIAHERVFGGEGDADIIDPKVGPALTPGAASWLNGNCDYICQTYLRSKVLREALLDPAGNPMLDGEGKPLVTEMPTKQTEFCLRTAPSPRYKIGFRTVSDDPLPECIVNPTFAKILKLILDEQ